LLLETLLNLHQLIHDRVILFLRPGEDRIFIVVAEHARKALVPPVGAPFVIAQQLFHFPS
jgi:hypothetical protein